MRIHDTDLVSESPLPARIETALRALERYAQSHSDPATALRSTVEAIWKVVHQAAAACPLGVSRNDARALLARRKLLRRGTSVLSAVIRRGVDSGAFRPACAPWAVERLPFAIVAGACVHWMLGLSHRPSLRARTAVRAALEVLMSKDEAHRVNKVRERSGEDRPRREMASIREIQREPRESENP